MLILARLRISMEVVSLEKQALPHQLLCRIAIFIELGSESRAAFRLAGEVRDHLVACQQAFTAVEDEADVAKHSVHLPVPGGKTEIQSPVSSAILCCPSVQGECRGMIKKKFAE